MTRVEETLDFKGKRERLFGLYDQFETAARPFIDAAVCKAGCADCCTSVGNVDATTLEGMVILTHLQNLPPADQKAFDRKLKENRKAKETSVFARCAFLLPSDTCGIYAVRPFSCRRLYSVRACGETGPMLHRQLWAQSEETLEAIHQLDDTGYSGHLSFILQLLRDARFRKTYLTGGFSPEAVEAFGKRHGLVINRFAARA